MKLKVDGKIIIAFVILISFFLNSCGFSSSKVKPATEEEFLTLSDVAGDSYLKEDSPGVRVINAKSKAFIKKNDIRAAKQKAVETGKNIAVEAVVQELLTADVYNEKFKEIERYFSSNIDKFIIDNEVNGERRIYLDKFYGIYASYKINRQKVLVALQKELKVIDKSSSALITVITSKKGLNLSSIGIRFSDVEDALMNQIQTDLNQRGLRAIDFRNAVVSLSDDPKKRRIFTRMSKDQFMAMVAGSKAGEAALNRQIQQAEGFYSTGLRLLKQLAKIVVEVNIISVRKTGENMVLNLGVTAKNISVGTGGAFANTIVQVARRAGAQTDDSSMLTGLIKDAYEEMLKQFIPQVIKEMSTISAGGDKLTSYELVMKGFRGGEPRVIRKAIEKSQDDSFRYINFDNTLKKVKPYINIIFVRFAGKPSQLADKVMDILIDNGISADEPIIAPKVTDLVFEKLKKEE